jgi:hypothetical protein
MALTSATYHGAVENLCSTVSDHLVNGHVLIESRQGILFIFFWLFQVIIASLILPMDGT